mgnify:FL=1
MSSSSLNRLVILDNENIITGVFPCRIRTTLNRIPAPDPVRERFNDISAELREAVDEQLVEMRQSMQEFAAMVGQDHAIACKILEQMIEITGTAFRLLRDAHIDSRTASTLLSESISELLTHDIKEERLRIRPDERDRYEQTAHGIFRLFFDRELGRSRGN